MLCGGCGVSCGGSTHCVVHFCQGGSTGSTNTSAHFASFPWSSFSLQHSAFSLSSGLEHGSLPSPARHSRLCKKLSRNDSVGSGERGRLDRCCRRPANNRRSLDGFTAELALRGLITGQRDAGQSDRDSRAPKIQLHGSGLDALLRLGRAIRPVRSPSVVIDWSCFEIRSGNESF
jgi:hypothetical protein